MTVIVGVVRSWFAGFANVIVWATWLTVNARVTGLAGL